VRLPLQLCDERPRGAPCLLPRSWRGAGRDPSDGSGPAFCSSADSVAKLGHRLLRAVGDLSHGTGEVIDKRVSRRENRCMERQPGGLTLSDDDRRVLAVLAADCAERTVSLFGA